MKKFLTKRRIWAVVLLTLPAASASAALLGRAPTTPGGTDYQAYYDTALDVTWLADANLPLSQSFGVSRIRFDGSITWTRAQSWITGMNAANWLGASDWRLPHVVDTGSPGCDFGYYGTDCGFFVQTADESTVYSEIAHLFYVTLGNSGNFGSDGGPQLCSGYSPYCFANQGPFTNWENGYYWTGTTSATNSAAAWFFYLPYGTQEANGPKFTERFLLPLRDGDIALVPIPGAGWLLGPAFAVLVRMRRVRRSN